MKLEEKNLIVKRSYKEVYRCDDLIIKIFSESHPKSDVFNEALLTARIEETGLDIPKVKEVTQIDGKWAIAIEYKEGKTLEEMMQSDRKNKHAPRGSIHSRPPVSTPTRKAREAITPTTIR